MAIVAYKRVSSISQNADRQDFAGITIDKVYEDRASGANTDRPELKACLDYVREGDTLLVHSIDRLARSLQDLTKIIEQLTTKGVTVKFIKEGLTFTKDTSNPANELMLNVLGAIAQFERALIRERQAEGIAKAKAEGKYKGRSKALTEEEVQSLKADAELGIPKTKLADKYGIGRTSVYKYLEN
ncbi:recombinase family protein [Thiomicrorhabdus sp. 6S2-11]|uniref:Recombinase family protein n=1 Tax=Thiomicrorhabdus marina TaxID=2818442 RepID=A0ABS3Q3R6_9GAMM|nr:recombinase family protein [Thiomicrorhabdus marina]MBO1926738.1 recombinase family protein [Thiomicrorhabdus marina]